MIFKPKMTNYAEMITKRLQLTMKLVKWPKTGWYPRYLCGMDKKTF